MYGTHQSLGFSPFLGIFSGSFSPLEQRTYPDQLVWIVLAGGLISTAAAG